MLRHLRHRLFTAFGDACIRRAMRTPYFHLFHEDGRPYMQRYWLLRIGRPKGWRAWEAEIRECENRLLSLQKWMTAGTRRILENRMAELHQRIYPRFGIRIHRILSSDERTFHDHPWNYTTVILRGGYTEHTPVGFQPHQVETTTQYDGHDPITYTQSTAIYHGQGSILRRRASSWHYLTLENGTETWTLFAVGRKRQRWGFLVDGLQKVPYPIYFKRRALKHQKVTP